MENFIKSQTGQPEWYPQRHQIPQWKESWSLDYPWYNPPEYTAQVVFENDYTKKDWWWADPEDLYEKEKRPLNPTGRTWISWRWLFWKWWSNDAVDSIVIREKPWFEGIYQVITIVRDDCEKIAIPWGMVDEWESYVESLERELKEETWAEIDMIDSILVFEWIVNDPRNTDNAWMKTIAKTIFLNQKEAESLILKAWSDARDVDWMDINEKNLSSMYANHWWLIRRALNDILYEKFKNFTK